jgi:hypothetical protein
MLWVSGFQDLHRLEIKITWRRTFQNWTWFLLKMRGRKDLLCWVSWRGLTSSDRGFETLWAITMKVSDCPLIKSSRLLEEEGRFGETLHSILNVWWLTLERFSIHWVQVIVSPSYVDAGCVWTSQFHRSGLLSLNSKHKTIHFLKMKNVIPLFRSANIPYLAR